MMTMRDGCAWMSSRHTGGLLVAEAVGLMVAVVVVGVPRQEEDS